MPFPRVAVIRRRPIGGSFALAAEAGEGLRPRRRQRGSAANMKLALESGAIDRSNRSGQRGQGGDLVLIATPVAHSPRVQENSFFAGPMRSSPMPGSTKRDVVKPRAGVKAGSANCSAHPIAGAEKSGAARSAELFRGRRVVITPLPENRDEAVEKLNQAVAHGRAHRPHDAGAARRRIAAVPVPASACLRAGARGSAAQERGRALSFAAGGFRDFTRIASAIPRCGANLHRNADPWASRRYSKKLAR